MSPSDDRHPVELLAEEFIARCRAGEYPSIEEYIRRYPDLAEDIRDVFPAILMVETVKAHSRPTAGLHTPFSQPHLERLGDFHILRELGRGGMGIVYEAEQESLGRRVAIKVLPQQFLNDASRCERFEREARTAARLHHTNIVPIFGIGEQEGYHYFVMQRIHGVGLDQIYSALRRQGGLGDHQGSGRAHSHDHHVTSDLGELARRLLNEHSTAADASEGTKTMVAGDVATTSSKAVEQPEPPFAMSSPAPEAHVSVLNTSYWRTLARLFAQAADALAYAHSQGVQHRDVKPGNLLLSPDGALWVTDFGLAKVADYAGSITNAGDVVGTLRYMAPEQFRGQSDERSDIYSLGVTLYEFATLSPAFSGKGRHGLLRAITDESPAPPRKIRPTMPRDLETIILRATSKDPGRRYSTADELRDDLERFIADLPIKARRVSLAERSWRWSRRNPALAASIGLVFILLAGVTAISSTAYVRVRRAEHQTSNALAGETKQRQRAQATADLAIQALDLIFDEFAPESTIDARTLNVDDSTTSGLEVAMPAAISRDTAELLDHLLSFYERLGGQDGDSFAMQTKIAAANRRVGQIYEWLGRYSEAATAYVAALDVYAKLEDRSTTSESFTVDIARTHNILGRALISTGHIAEARRHFNTALTQLINLPQDREALAVQFELARTHYLLGRRGDDDVARNIRPDPESPGEPGAPPPLVRGNRQSVEPTRHRRLPPHPPFNAGRNSRREAGRPPLRIGEGGARPVLPFIGGQSLLRATQEAMAPRQGPGESGPGRGRREHIDAAIEILESLCGAAPSHPEYRWLLALALRETAGPNARGPHLPDPPRTAMDDRANEAAGLLESLVAEFPRMPQYRVDLAQTYLEMGRNGEQRYLEQATVMLEELVRTNPDVPNFGLTLAHARMELGKTAREEGRIDDALEQYAQGLRLQRSLAEKFPDAVGISLVTALYETWNAELLWETDQAEASARALEAALQRLEAPRVEQPSEGFLAMDTLNRIGRLADMQGRPDLSEQARALGEKLRPLLPRPFGARMGPPPGQPERRPPALHSADPGETTPYGSLTPGPDARNRPD